MTTFVCVDDDFGLMFNKRRQSQDSVLRRRIIDIVNGNKLYMSDYSYGQFKNETNANIAVAGSDFSEAANDSFVFLEDGDIEKIFDRIDVLYIYKWNRSYPSDKKLNLDFSKMKLISSEDFIGSSHPQITEEIYRINE